MSEVACDRMTSQLNIPKKKKGIAIAALNILRLQEKC